MGRNIEDHRAGIAAAIEDISKTDDAYYKRRDLKDVVLHHFDQAVKKAREEGFERCKARIQRFADTVMVIVGDD